MPRPPINPDSFDKVNFVIDAWTTGCDAPWYIYIETMKPAALEAFIVLISFGWADVIRGRLRPKGLGRRTSKRKGRWNRRLPSFPEIGNTLGKSIPLGEQLEDFVKWGNATRFLWRIDNAMQAALFMWLVADVAEDFVFNWTSLLYESYWCQDPALGRFSYRREAYYNSFGGGWRLMTYPTEDYETTPPEWFHSSGSSGPTGCTVAAAISVKPFPPYDGPTEFEVAIFKTGTQERIAETGIQETNSDREASVPLIAQVPPGTSFQVRFRHNAQWAYVGAGAVVGVQVKAE